MPKIFWKSLRSRILLLVVLTFLFLAAAAVSLFTFLRNRHAETLALTEHHLVSVASNLARNYADHRTTDNSLRTIKPGPHRHRLHPPLLHPLLHALKTIGHPILRPILSKRSQQKHSSTKMASRVASTLPELTL
jgi:hypothetical protein